MNACTIFAVISPGHSGMKLNPRLAGRGMGHPPIIRAEQIKIGSGRYAVALSVRMR
jgi:hypothetical protein